MASSCVCSNGVSTNGANGSNNGTNAIGGKDGTDSTDGTDGVAGATSTLHLFVSLCGPSSNFDSVPGQIVLHLKQQQWTVEGSNAKTTFTLSDDGQIPETLFQVIRYSSAQLCTHPVDQTCTVCILFSVNDVYHQISQQVNTSG